MKSYQRASFSSKAPQRKKILDSSCFILIRKQKKIRATKFWKDLKQAEKWWWFHHPVFNFLKIQFWNFSLCSQTTMQCLKSRSINSIESISFEKKTCSCHLFLFFTIKRTNQSINQSIDPLIEKCINQSINQEWLHQTTYLLSRSRQIDPSA